MDLQDTSSRTPDCDAVAIEDSKPTGSGEQRNTSPSATAIRVGSDLERYLVASKAYDSVLAGGQGLVLEEMEDETGAIVRPAHLQPAVGAANRAIDIVFSALLLIGLLPVMLLVGLAIFILDPGPILFRHTRIGRDGRKFKCLKFRTMYVGAEERLAHYIAKDPELRRQWNSGRKLNPDPRVTPVGRILRSTSVDEIPQLINVLRGEMSLVGPRPIVDEEVSFYGRYISNYLSVRPGLTGLWQISGRNETTYRRRVAMDVLYTRRVCVWLNLSIIAATIPAVLVGRGAS